MPRLVVEVRACGQERIMVPLDRSWDTFLLDGPIMSEIFPVERAPQEQAERIAF
jgi:antitoxin VapB